MKLPERIQEITNALSADGWENYVVGGAVRDFLLRRQPTDYDLATPARPEEVLRALAEFSPDGSNVRYGSVTIGEGRERVEITTFRVESAYSDMRRPDKVEFTRNLAEDLARRDFTINAIAYNPRTGYIDPYDGRGDIRRGLLRAVGDARESFSLDALRIMRAARFSAQLGFPLETATRAAASELKANLSRVSKDRLREELFSFVCGRHAGDALLGCKEIIFEVIPELAASDGFNQYNPNHCFDVLGHTAETLRRSNRGLTVRLAALLHDVGKPDCFTREESGRGRFWGHMERGEELARVILSRLRCEQRLADTVCSLVLNHDKPYAPTPASAREWLAKMGSKNIFYLIELKRADCLAHARSYHNRLSRIYGFKREVVLALRRGDCYSLGALAVSGARLCEALDIKPGPEVGELLQRLLEAVIAGKIKNDAAELLKLAGEYHKTDKETEK